MKFLDAEFVKGFIRIRTPNCFPWKGALAMPLIAVLSLVLLFLGHSTLAGITYTEIKGNNYTALGGSFIAC